MVTQTAPTQVRFSARSVVRTVLQTIVPAVLALGVVVPEVVQIVLEQSGEAMPDGLRASLLAVSAGIAAVAGALAKIMALPKVEALLRSSVFTRWLAAEPTPVPPVDVVEDAAPQPIMRHDTPPSMDHPLDGPDADYAPRHGEV